MDWFVLTLSGILGCVFLFVSLYLFALYSHPADKGVFNSIITKFIIVVAWLPSLLLPLDAANAVYRPTLLTSKKALEKNWTQWYLSSHDIRGRVIEGGVLWSEKSLEEFLFKTKLIEEIWEKEESDIEISSSFWEIKHLQNGIKFHEHQPLLIYMRLIAP